VSLTVSYQGTDFTVEEDTAAFIGSGEAATIRIVRPGISRRHAVVSYDGTTWKFEDAGSRNGSFADGDRIHVITIDDQISLCLGHPSDGELVTLTPEGAEPVATPDEDIQDEIDAFVLPETPPATAAPARTARPMPAAASTAPPTVTESTELAEAIREQISAIKGLTWSVWAMIAVTAALAVMTLFVGILGS
jgi:pSer/pThr/pTyr-binding forkhead associated (FHA) protein